MKKLLAMLAVGSIAAFGLGCSGSSTSKPVKPVTYSEPSDSPSSGGAPKSTGAASTKSAEPVATKDMTVKLAAADATVMARKTVDVKITATRGKDATAALPLKFEVTAAGSAKPADLKIADASIEAGKTEATVKVESTADAAGEYKVKVSTTAADMKATPAEFTVKVTK